MHLQQFNSQLGTHYPKAPRPNHSFENVQLFNSNQKLLFIKIFLQLEDMGTKDSVRRANAFSPVFIHVTVNHLLKQKQTHAECGLAT